MTRWTSPAKSDKTHLTFLSDLSRSLVYWYAHSERPAERARIGLRRRNRAAKFPSAGLIFGIISSSRRNGSSFEPPRQNRIPAREGRRPVAWNADMGRVRWKPEKLHWKGAQNGTAVQRAVSPPLMYLSGLSQAPHLMHRRRFSFPAPTDVWKQGKKEDSLHCKLTWQNN